jgi:superfamily II DNA or RNA helicase
MTVSFSTVNSQFSATDRTQGLDCLLERKALALQIGDQGAIAKLNGKYYYDICTTALNLRQTAEGQLGVYCSCQRYREMGTCSHLYALVRLVESETGLRLSEQDWNLFLCDLSSVVVGSPLSRARIADVRSSNGQAVGRKRTVERREVEYSQAVQSPGTHWLHGLTQLKQVDNRSRSGESHKANRCGPDERLLYVLDLAELAESERFYLELILEKKGARGQLQCEPLDVDVWPIENLGATEDQHLMLLLTTDPHAYTVRDASDRHGADSRDDQLLDDDDDDNHHTLRLTLPSTLAERTLQALAQSGRFYWTMDLSELDLYQPIGWEDAKWGFVLQVSEVGNDSYSVTGMLQRVDKPTNSRKRATFRSLDEVVGVCETGAILFQNSVTVIPERDAKLLRTCREHGNMLVGRGELDDFLTRIVDVVPPEQLVLPLGLIPETVVGEPGCRVIIHVAKMNSDLLQVEMEFLYGAAVLSTASAQTKVWDSDSQSFVARNLHREAELIAVLRDHPAIENRLVFGSPDLSVSRQRLPQLVADFAKLGIEVYAQGNLQRSGATYSLSVSSGENWFDLETEVNFGDVSVPFPELLAAIRSGRKFIRLDDGSEGILPEQLLKAFRGVTELGNEENGKLRFRPSQALMLDAWLENQPAKLDSSFRQWVKKLSNFNGIKAQREPVTFQGELRDYQRDGLGWFKFLEEFRFGGCLADDMGLGKTVQVLALLERRRTQQLALRETSKPSIAIVPKSLIYNWVAEAARFAPELKVIDYTGSQRKATVEALQDANLIVTTYATFRLDIETLREIKFDYAILDEAQAIKNPNCQATKAVRLLQANYRLAMTGTPIENHLGDLWSILNFLNPGMLGSLKPTYFARTGDDPEANGRLESLSRALSPFILRRTKAQVLTELPEKSEQILYCDMTPRQNKHYQELRKYYAQNLKRTVAEVGLKKAKIQVLEALLRLRQVACDPRLVSPKERACGAKLNLLMEQLEEMLSEGHKALVFSQFTSMLALVRKELVKRKWNYEYLDGRTTNRGRSVTRFQEDPKCQLFLISLKAGGHGLNLTAADYVYILDPWWNPAVEAQAVDRAHRMGQQKPVMAYRLIARNTVEEKIAHMQESKKKLAEAVISSDQSLLRSLSMDDLRVLFE